MHEFGLCEGIVATIQQWASGRRVARVRLRVGAMHRVNEEAFKQAFSWAAADSEAQGASVDLIITSIRARCQVCSGETESYDPVTVCRHCGALHCDIVQGSEIVLESIEYENISGAK